MSKKSYSSKNFGETKNHLIAEMPERLIHKNVMSGEMAQKFSEERKHPVHIVDVDSKTISMTIGGLLPRQQTNRHRHSYETIIYIQKGKGTSLIEDKEVPWEAGDAIYVPVWAWHSHRNDTDEDCVYIACENAPLMQNLGAALREES